MVKHSVGTITQATENILVVSTHLGKLVGEGKGWDIKRRLPIQFDFLNSKIKSGQFKVGDCIVTVRPNGLLACLILPEMHTYTDINHKNIRDTIRALTSARSLYEGTAMEVVMPDDLVYGGTTKIYTALLKLAVDELGNRVHIVSGTKKKFDRAELALDKVSSREGTKEVVGG